MRGLHRLCVIVACASPAILGSTGAADAAAPVDGSPIVAAKREFEAIKAAGAGVEQQKLALPLERLPSIDLKTDATPLPSPLARERQKELEATAAKESRNWLVEEMDRDDEKVNGSAKASRWVSPLEMSSLRQAAGGKKELDLLAHGRETSPASISDKSAGRTVANPLAKYMENWISTKDFALLGNTSDPNALPAGSVLFSASEIRSSTPGAAATGSASPGGHPGEVTNAAPLSNPYITENVFPTAPIPSNNTASAVSLAPAAVQSTASPSLLTTVPTTAAQKPVTARDLLKPDSDERYFKQMKRF